MFSNLIFATVLFAIAALLMLQHEFKWRKVQRTERDTREVEFARRQYRRRLQASGLIGAVAVAIAVSGWIEHPPLVLFYWIGVVLIVVWILLLGLADWVSSYAHFQRIHKRQLAEHAALQAELKAELERRRPPASDDTHSDPEATES